MSATFWWPHPAQSQEQNYFLFTLSLRSFNCSYPLLFWKGIISKGPKIIFQHNSNHPFFRGFLRSFFRSPRNRPRYPESAPERNGFREFFTPWKWMVGWKVKISCMGLPIFRSYILVLGSIIVGWVTLFDTCSIQEKDAGKAFDDLLPFLLSHCLVV